MIDLVLGIIFLIFAASAVGFAFWIVFSGIFW